MCSLKQVEIGNINRRAWAIGHPLFYGRKTNEDLIRNLYETEIKIQNIDHYEAIDVNSSRVLAAFHGPLGAKVPLTCSTIAGCIRPDFVHLNSALKNKSCSCYNGGCYLYHARAVPAKKLKYSSILAHHISKDSLIAAAKISSEYGLPIRDNQSSDGSVSMALPSKGSDLPELITILETLNEHGFQNVPYLCFSAAYTSVPKKYLKMLGDFKNLIVHVTVSGWHEKDENILRINEFLKYSEYIHGVFLRVVNRMDWVEQSRDNEDTSAKCENWLLNKILKLNLASKVIRTPYHSVRPFPGSAIGSLGTRHMASTDYSDTWGELLSHGARECCMTGKCKTCDVLCGSKLKVKTQDPKIAAMAYESLLVFEKQRQKKCGVTPLAVYVERLLVKKVIQMYDLIGIPYDCEFFKKCLDVLNKTCKFMPLSSSERNRLTNDCHALVVDGIDRHGLWNTCQW